MAVFMSEGLAEILEVPSDGLVIDVKNITKFRIKETSGTKRVSIRINDSSSVASAIRTVGKLAVVQLDEEVVELRITDVTFRAKANTFDIKGIVLNT